MKRRRFQRGAFDFSWNGPVYLLRVELGRFMISIVHNQETIRKRRKTK